MGTHKHIHTNIMFRWISTFVYQWNDYKLNLKDVLCEVSLLIFASNYNKRNNTFLMKWEPSASHWGHACPSRAYFPILTSNTLSLMFLNTHQFLVRLLISFKASYRSLVTLSVSLWNLTSCFHRFWQVKTGILWCMMVSWLTEARPCQAFLSASTSSSSSSVGTVSFITLYAMPDCHIDVTQSFNKTAVKEN